MDGAHDMGGVAGYGPVVPEPNEPVFHSPWERRVFAVTLAMAKPGGWNLDESRFAREDRPPQDYLGKSYYQIWLAGVERLMTERNLLTSGEIEAGRPLHPAKPAPVLKADEVLPMLRRGGPSEREAPGPARFAVGDRVRAREINPPTHTRLPHYVRGKTGVIELLHGAHVFPDSNACGFGEAPQWLYTVTFSGKELWGDAAEPGSAVSVDAWQCYLEPA